MGNNKLCGYYKAETEAGFTETGIMFQFSEQVKMLI